MPETTTAPCESADVDVEAVEYLPASDREPPGRPTAGGLATYYRLRCLALEARIATLESELERQERRREELRARYEDVLQNRDPDDELVFTQFR